MIYRPAIESSHGDVSTRLTDSRSNELSSRLTAAGSESRANDASQQTSIPNSTRSSSIPPNDSSTDVRQSDIPPIGGNNAPPVGGNNAPPVAGNNAPPVGGNNAPPTADRGSQRRRSTRHQNYLNRSQLHQAVELPDGYGKWFGSVYHIVIVSVLVVTESVTVKL